MHERLVDQNDPSIDTIADLQRSITATLTYIVGGASVAELFGLQAYLSQMASQIKPPLPVILQDQLSEIQRLNEQLRQAQKVSHSPQAPWYEDKWGQELEKRRQQAIYQEALAHQVAGQYRQES